MTERINLLPMAGRLAVASLALVAGLVAYWSTLVAGLSSNYPWLGEVPDEALLPAAFATGLLLTLGIGKLSRQGVAGYLGGCLVVLMCAAVLVLAPDHLA